jgi:O-antigen/teichoic acid export membrane protein
MGGYLIQTSIIAHKFGLNGLGVFALAVSYVAFVGVFFDIQPGEVAMVFSAGRTRDTAAVAGIYQASYGIAGALGLVGFAVVVVTAPYASQLLTGDANGAIFAIYAGTLLTGAAQTTSLSLLRLLDRVGWIVRMVLAREALRVLLVLYASLVIGTLEAVALAVVVTEAVFAFLLLASATRAFVRKHRESLWRPSIDATRGLRRQILGMLFHTNLITYSKAFTSQGPALFLGVLWAPETVGAFKIGTAVGAVAGKPADPAVLALMPRLSRLLSERRHRESRQLIVESATFVGATVTGFAALLFLFREPVLRLAGGAGAELATTVLALALLTQIAGGFSFWNRPLLLAMHQARIASEMYLLGALLLGVLCVALVPHWASNGAAAAILITAVVSNTALCLRSLSMLSDLAESDEGSNGSLGEQI